MSVVPHQADTTDTTNTGHPPQKGSLLSSLRQATTLSYCSVFRHIYYLVLEILKCLQYNGNVQKQTVRKTDEGEPTNGEKEERAR
jgi:hypothetical protein